MESNRDENPLASAMRLTYVPESFPQASETFIVNEIWGMLEAGHEVTVCPRFFGDEAAMSTGRCADVLKRARLALPGDRRWLAALPEAVRCCSPVWRGRRPAALRAHLRTASVCTELAWRVRESRPDVIVNHFGYDNAVASAIVARKQGVPLVLVMHGSDYYTVPHRSIRWVERRCAAVVVASRYGLSTVRGLGLTLPVMVSRLGVDVDAFRAKAAFSRATRPTIICVARLGHNKGHERLLSVLAAVRASVPDVDLWLVGGGPLENRLRELASALGLDGSVTFWGAQPPHRVAALLSQAWVKTLFSEKEGLGVVVMEAMAAGLPCVASLVGGIPELIEDGRTGYLVDWSKPEAAESAARRLVELLRDEGLRLRLGRNASAYASQCCSEKAHFARMDALVRAAYSGDPESVVRACGREV